MCRGQKTSQNSNPFIVRSLFCLSSEFCSSYLKAAHLKRKSCIEMSSFSRKIQQWMNKFSTCIAPPDPEKSMCQNAKSFQKWKIQAWLLQLKNHSITKRLKRTICCKIKNGYQRQSLNKVQLRKPNFLGVCEEETSSQIRAKWVGSKVLCYIHTKVKIIAFVCGLVLFSCFARNVKKLTSEQTFFYVFAETQSCYYSMVIQ